MLPHLGCIARGDALLVQHWDYGRSGTPSVLSATRSDGISRTEGGEAGAADRRQEMRTLTMCERIQA